jgi:NADH dehydrogenase FAD-containing subunit
LESKNILTLLQTAQVASQEGKYLAGELSAIVNEKPLLPFTYHHLGSLAKIGTGDAVAEIGPLASGGLWAWWLWGAAYLSRQYSMRNRFNILLDWLRKTVFGRDVSRF